MSGTDYAPLSALYGPTLAEKGESLAAQLAELSARPTACGCDQMIRELSEAATAVRRLRARLLGQSEANA